jgi:hypothetical protein
MQQWLDVLPVAGGLLNLAVALTDLCTAILKRRKRQR